jgi:hypothetical protein
MLTAYFAQNKADDFARGILYHDFLKFYTWHPNGKFLKRRVYEGRKQVGRIVSAHLAEGERYYLRVLLNHVVGATSFEHLKMVDGVVQPSFREAAEKRGLIEEDNTLDECLTEATMIQMPSSLRRLSNVFGLWQKHLDAISEEYR